MKADDAGRVWLITGCSSGFGRAVADAALRCGDKVIGTLRRPEQFAEFEALAPGRAHALELDVAHPDQIARAVPAAIARYGRIDVLLNNAGYGMIGAVEETSLAEARAIFETNFFGMLQVTQALLPQLRQQRSGHIVNMSSGSIPRPSSRWRG
jgi:NAD(P)-dependent dehydrogenase (short-subunit alcohol dehydrogenase family)